MTQYQTIRKEIQAAQFLGHDHPFTPPEGVVPLPLYWGGDGKGGCVGSYQSRQYWIQGKHQWDPKVVPVGSWLVRGALGEGGKVINEVLTTEQFEERFEPIPE